MNGTASLSACAALTSPEDRLITVIGAGGKTSLVKWIARQKQKAGQRVIITTTTKIFPLHDVGITLLEDDSDFLPRLQQALNDSTPVIVANRHDEKTGKLVGIAPETVDALHESGLADSILVEADGAARKPLKAPASHEPVIPSLSDVCIGVMGLDATYHPLTESMVHRHEIFSRITGAQPHEPVTPAHMVCVATASNGFFKGCPPQCRRIVLLNKADIPKGQSVVSDFEKEPSIATFPHIAWFAGSCFQQTVKRIDHQYGMPRVVNNHIEQMSQL